MTVTRGESGYSLIELMIVALLIGVLGAMAGVQIGASRPAYQADGAMRVMMAELNAARDTAVAQRRQVRVTLSGTDTITVIRVDDPDADPEVTTTLRSISFEAGVQFGRLNDTLDTPDDFGSGSIVTTNDTITFNHEGMAIAADGTPVNQTVFLRIPGQSISQRAVTVLGATGRVRAYRWLSGDEWTRV
jgi:prepilin-type N-terminal cleavage/methylation domain-containing protein